MEDMSDLQMLLIISVPACVSSSQPVRFAAKKSGKTSRNKRKRTPGQNYGWKKNDGDYVEGGMILYRQLGLKVYPGSHVGISISC